MERVYPSDLIDAQWELIAPLIPPARPGGGRVESTFGRWSTGFFTFTSLCGLVVRLHCEDWLCVADAAERLSGLADGVLFWRFQEDGT
ncbi:MAG: hypothetical protein NZ602_17520 [Thermoguttaceae bacterium]|nr:hypothetical protein [Thermoguttaceae bacterium]MDW8036607.1 hypothetical protein [Thermoguttaceae bacterium]